jgi:hypothetical protein
MRQLHKNHFCMKLPPLNFARLLLRDYFNSERVKYIDPKENTQSAHILAMNMSSAISHIR